LVALPPLELSCLPGGFFFTAGQLIRFNIAWIADIVLEGNFASLALN